MASMRDIKRRKGSIESTQQITKAMKLVSTVRLQRARLRAENSKAYFNCMYETVNSMLAKAGNVNHPYLKQGTSSRKAVVVITSNRGLAGGYNSGIIKLITRGDFDKDELDIYALGKKGKEFLSRYGYTIKEDDCDKIDDPVYAEAMGICSRLLKSYAEGEIGEIYLAYTAFKNTVVHEPTLIKLLPAAPIASQQEEDEEKPQATALMNFEPEDEEALNLIIPKYVTSLIYGGMVESVASENGARMQAMDSATSNAEEMISKLALQYNRARQGSITQELTEIIGGAAAIS
ncbi:MAG: ATP synthase F1 subunit gamma [Lachnospiraceae bacterium]|nr:ATP synthase F1 subunit gamma [Lachnospiraceae bacterium]